MSHERRAGPDRLGQERGHATDRDAGGSAGPALDGVCAELGTLPTGAFITEEALAAMLGKSRRSIRRAVERGELPPPVRMMGKRTWTAGVVIQHLEQRLEEAARGFRRLRQKTSRYSP